VEREREHRLAGGGGISGQRQEGYAIFAGERVGRDAQNGDVVRRVDGDDGGLEQARRGIGPADDEVGLAAVAEGFENVSVGEQVALLVDEKGVSEEGVVVAARGGGLVEAVHNGAHGGVGGCVLLGTVRGSQGEGAGTGAEQGRDCVFRSAIEGFGQVFAPSSKYKSTSGRWGMEAGERYSVPWREQLQRGGESENCCNSRFAKILAFEQKRLAGNLGEGVRKTVAEVQSGCVAGLAEI